jgi:hypothetical protein
MEKLDKQHFRQHSKGPIYVELVQEGQRSGSSTRSVGLMRITAAATTANDPDSQTY